MSTLDRIMKKPTMNIGIWYPPVHSLTAPVMYGAANPPRLPTVLMSATPAAAAAPDRNCVGTVQKFGSAAKIEHAVIAMTATVAAGEFM
jgi:hypothetical protein